MERPPGRWMKRREWHFRPGVAWNREHVLRVQRQRPLTGESRSCGVHPLLGVPHDQGTWQYARRQLDGDEATISRDRRLTRCPTPTLDEYAGVQPRRRQGIANREGATGEVDGEPTIEL